MGEIFARPLPDTPLPFTGERLTSALTGETEIEHLHRYLIARELCRGKDVLDVASGEGYGTALLAQAAASAVGIEIAEDAVEHARNSYKRDNLRFLQGDARAMDIPSESIDIVVSFETIEHFAEQEQFLKEVRRVLRPNGMCIVSTPDRDNYSPAETSANPYHVLELTREEFRALMSRHFAHVCYLMQRPVIGSVMLPSFFSAATGPALCFEKRGERHFEASQGLARPRYVIALASDGAVGNPSPTVYFETSSLGSLTSPQGVETLRQALESKACAVEELQRQQAEDKTRLSECEHRRSMLEEELGRSKHHEAVLRMELDQGKQQETILRMELDQGRQQEIVLRIALERATQQEAALRVELDRSKQQEAGLRQELDRSKQENNALRASTSWRVTAPLRGTKQLWSSTARAFRHRLSSPRSPRDPSATPAPPPPVPPKPNQIPSLGNAPLCAPTIQLKACPISVVIPTHNRSDLLEETLRSCIDHSADVEIELVVIDDGSTDDTATVLTRLKEEIPNLTWRRVQNGGPGKARNLGASIAKHSVVLFLGDDIQPIDSNFFSVHARLHALNSSDRFAVLGKVVWPDDVADVNFVMSHIQGHGGEQFGYAHLTPYTFLDWRFFYTCNISVKKSIVSDWMTDGFRPQFIFAAFEDTEFAYRLQRQSSSLKIYYDPASVGQHVHPYTVNSFFQRQLNAGMMAKIFVDLHPEVLEPLGFAPLVRALSRPSSPNQEELTADYMSIVDGIKSWARVLDKDGALGRSWWHSDFLSAVFEVAYLQGFLLMRAEDSTNFAAGYQHILGRCIERLRKAIHRELTDREFLQNGLGFGVLVG